MGQNIMLAADSTRQHKRAVISYFLFLPLLHKFLQVFQINFILFFGLPVRLNKDKKMIHSLLFEIIIL